MPPPVAVANIGDSGVSQPAVTKDVPASGTSRTGGDDDPLLGTVLLDRVRIERPIARGGMGKVYYGQQVRMNRPCAIKILDPRLGGGGDVAEFTRRFLLEASIAAKLTHPNVVTIFDYGETADGRCFIAMEYLDGRSLSQELKNVGRLSADRAIHITRQVARALREAHALGVVHRDMKPGNVYLLKRDDDDDVVKVLDFGLVKDNAAVEAQDHTQFGQIMGSPRYMAPEQVQGKHVDGRTDVYSVGAMLYAMLAGKPPFDRSSDMAILMAQVSEAPPPIASVAPEVVLPRGLEAVVMKCLAKDPDQRFASMEELVEALKLRVDGSSGIADSGSQPVARLTAPVLPVATEPKRFPRALVLGGAAVVGVVGVVVALLAGSSRPPGAGASGASPLSTPNVTASPAVPAATPPRPTATLHVDSDPPGAKVKEEGDTVCESTPCDIVYSGDQADPTYEHLLTFQKSDYKLETRLV